MHFRAWLATLALSLGSAAPLSAFDCTNRFASAEVAIEKATEAMNALPDGDRKNLVQQLIDDAKTRLKEAHQHHEQPTGAHDHGFAIAKAGASVGYAEAAEILAQN